MPKNVLRGLGVVLGILFLCGCTATKDVEVRRYVEIKDRVDQDMEGGNAGYLAGTPQPEDRSDFKTTRKIYVLEVSKGTEIESEEQSRDVMDDDGAMMEESMGEERDFESEGYMDDEEGNMGDLYESDMYEADEDMTERAAVTYTEYTVQKDDTLQKISKKFYDSYSKWPKIYEVNKDVIGDPDRIKPGIVLQIPSL